MLRLAIIADDLTGASDSGVQVARRGLPAQVVFDWKGLAEPSASQGTLVIDTDSRAVPGSLAYSRVRAAAASLQAQGCRFIYKKMDSTLRGNLGQEIDAVLDVYGFGAALVVPAFPRIGRTTVGGIHYLNGVPIHETEIGRDPKTPVPEAEITKLLAAQSRRKAASVQLDAIRGGQEALETAIEQALSAGAELIVLDAETDQDIQSLAALIPRYGERFLWAGSAGLAEYLPLGSEEEKEEERLGERPSPSLSGRLPVMLVAGSISRVTRAQLQKVNEQQGIVPVELDPLALLTAPGQAADEKTRCYHALSGALRAGADVSFYAGSSPEQVQQAQHLGAGQGMGASSVSDAIADALGEVAAKLAAAHPLQGLVLTGGDTAKAVCRHLGVSGIELMAEVEPGIPLGRLIGAGHLPAVTKAGAFGQTESLLRAMYILKGELGHE
ncbi:four-carbon acid sugar kinase family protein [Paenibacillus rigui]|uniref:four-carbon acid sugar kinase family protein n=1 Tax=Paenibacillus rigui TaxID=554312 RepID=UPI0015C5F093|nr:four-carbon acid sugar kinase family protein [Paenibacillus rigui]